MKCSILIGQAAKIATMTTHQHYDRECSRQYRNSSCSYSQITFTFRMPTSSAEFVSLLHSHCWVARGCKNGSNHFIYWGIDEWYTSNSFQSCFTDSSWILLISRSGKLVEILTPCYHVYQPFCNMRRFQLFQYRKIKGKLWGFRN